MAGRSEGGGHGSGRPLVPYGDLSLNWASSPRCEQFPGPTEEALAISEAATPQWVNNRTYSDGGMPLQDTLALHQVTSASVRSCMLSMAVCVHGCACMVVLEGDLQVIDLASVLPCRNCIVRPATPACC